MYEELPKGDFRDASDWFTLSSSPSVKHEFFLIYCSACHFYLDNDIECSDDINPVFVPSVSRICNENVIGS